MKNWIGQEASEHLAISGLCLIEELERKDSMLVRVWEGDVSVLSV